MKSLLLLRHAKSGNLVPGLNDFDRILTDGGRKAAELLGAYMSSHKVHLDLVMSSPAVRARETAEIVLRASNKRIDPQYDQRIYEATAQNLLDVIHDVEKRRKQILLVGHNPGLEELLGLLTGVQQPMGTASLAKLSADISEWNKCESGTCVLDWLVTGSELE
jgi:phosphohistidine phosphatase